MISFVTVLAVVLACGVIGAVFHLLFSIMGVVMAMVLSCFGLVIASIAAIALMGYWGAPVVIILLVLLIFNRKRA